MILSRNFTLSELTRSETAARLGIDNTPPDHVVVNLRRLTRVCLQPLRDAWGHPLIVTSGFRCEALNTAIGGKLRSFHTLGLAADLIPGGGQTASDLFEFFIAEADEREPRWQWDKAIIERVGGTEWLHVQIAPHYENAFALYETDDGKTFRRLAA